MALSSLVIAGLFVGGVAAGGHEPAAMINQLETARLPQQAQRGEFGVAGDNSAFKFTFANPVRSHLLTYSSTPINLTLLMHLA
jgi:hypothetical protein